MTSKKPAGKLAYGLASVAAFALFATVLPAKASMASDQSPTSPPSASSAPQDAPATSRVVVTFKDEAGVKVDGKKVVSDKGADVAPVAQALAGFSNVRSEKLITQSEESVESDLSKTDGDTAKLADDLNSHVRLSVGSPQDAKALAQKLSGAGVVESVKVEPAPAPPPASPNYVSNQGYRTAAPTGIDVTAAASAAGGNGSKVKIVDVEYSWNRSHEDLSGATTLYANGTPCDPFNDNNHGTAVLGEIKALGNAFGVTGLATGASVGVVNAARSDGAGGCMWDLANAINVARTKLSAGDVMLLEQQMWGPPGYDFVPVEWDAAVYDSIKAATAAGIVVIEPAGNGNANLNDAAFGTSFPEGKANSGAIIVGAGEAPNCGGEPARSRASFSTYGTRVNLQGWGECVYTTGYGDLFGTKANQFYTSTFNGTSSASPIVTSAAAILSSVIEAKTGKPATPKQVLDTLVATGTPQFTGTGALTGKIGPLPNLSAAIKSLDPKPLISEDFSKDASNFTVTKGGKWTVTGGRYVLTNSAKPGAPAGNANASVQNTAFNGDFKLTANGSTTATSSSSNDFSIIFDWVNADNYKYVSFSEANNGTTSGVFKVVNGVNTQVSDITSKITAGTTYTVRIERTGSTVKVWRNDTLVSTANSLAGVNGKAGFGSYDDGATFDNLVVTKP